MLKPRKRLRLSREDTTVDFQSVYKEEFFPQNLLNEIGKANMRKKRHAMNLYQTLRLMMLRFIKWNYIRR